MATLEQFVFRVQREYQKQEQKPPSKHIIRLDIVDGIRTIQDDVVLDALKELLAYEDTEMDGSTTTIDYPTRYGKFVSCKAEESDGDFGYPYDVVTRETFDERKRIEDDSEFDSTTTRYLTTAEIADAAALTPAWELYPTPVDGRDIRITFIQKSSESGTITLPTRLHLGVIYFASGQHEKYYAFVNMINKKYYNMYGLSSSVVGVTGEGL